MSDSGGSKPKGSEDFEEIDKELDDIQENEAPFDSDGVARSRSPGRCPSANGSVSSAGSGSRAKRRTWKKPKDKPKRPLSAYNIFFKHERSRIVEGKTEDCSAEEAIRSIENILSTSRETRRHRKTHGRISFGDLARKIAEKWKSIGAETKAVFEHYAELDMRRYRVEVKNWKERKEAEVLAGRGGDVGANSTNDSFSSIGSEAEYGLDNFTASQHSDDAWAPRRNFYDSMNSSFSSVDSELSLEPIPIGDMLRNARPNMHASMPNINTEIPGFVDAGGSSSQLMGNHMGQVGMGMAHFGQQSLTNMQFFQNQGMQMNNFGPPLVVSSGNPNTSELDQLRQQNNLQQAQLQRQQQILLRQQQLLQQQLQHTNQMISNQGIAQQQQHQLGIGGNNPFAFDQGGEGADLENYLTNLDLSHM